MTEHNRCDIRLLTESDLEKAMRLKEQARWNQTREDWQRLLQLTPQGCFAAVCEGELVGTITTILYGQQLAWIGMVLVDVEYRRRGIASQLMKAAHQYLHEAGVRTVKLDATPDGRKVYEALGYQTECLIERWSGIARSSLSGKNESANIDELTAILQIDLKAFGLDRSGLLASLYDKRTANGRVIKSSDSKVEGYVLTRPGTAASYIGPLVASSVEIAESLLDSACTQLSGQQVYVDVNTEFPQGQEFLSARGFIKQRDLYRMFYGENCEAGTSNLVMAIAGPELG